MYVNIPVPLQFTFKPQHTYTQSLTPKFQPKLRTSPRNNNNNNSHHFRSHSH
jgi:hypothetical protein